MKLFIWNGPTPNRYYAIAANVNDARDVVQAAAANLPHACDALDAIAIAEGEPDEILEGPAAFLDVS
jgi:hypothetical protein